METILNLNKFPVSICTMKGLLSDDESLLSCQIVKQDNNLVQFIPYIDPQKIYLEQHNNSIGETWAEHNELFSRLVKEYENKNIVEIGGGSGNIFSKFEHFDSWTVVDLNPSPRYDVENVTKIKSLYDSIYINVNDVVISSHVIEHMFYVESFLKDLSDRSPKYHIFSMPNMKGYAESKYSATIMQEHPTYLPEEVMDVLLLRNGWTVIEKVYFRDHSIFYVTQPNKNPLSIDIPDCSRDVINLFDYLQSRANSIKHQQFYVFGAHLTYYYLLNMGIVEEQIIAVIDNDWNKCGKRMYGFNTPVIHSSEVPGGAKVFLEMGPYNEEIRKRLNNVEFI